jgi:hypothetical protein
MVEYSPKVSRSLARYLVALVALLEAKRGVVSETERALKLAEFDGALAALSAAERAELEQLAGSLAATLAVASAPKAARA